jgi:hypothetical protein
MSNFLDDKLNQSIFFDINYFEALGSNTLVVRIIVRQCGVTVSGYLGNRHKQKHLESEDSQE